MNSASYSIIFIIFALQLAIAGIIFFVLRKILDRELVELALERFDRYKPEDELKSVKEIYVITYKPLSQLVNTRLSQLVNKKFQQARLVLKEEKRIKGGMVVQIGSYTIDMSLLSRLKNIWSSEV